VQVVKGGLIMGERFKGLTTYEQVANMVGLDDITKQRFIAFMLARFPNQQDLGCYTGYAQEWAETFKSKDEYNRADEHSRYVLETIDG
jgi:alkylated DNA nucleotide flippase Atl1